MFCSPNFTGALPFPSMSQRLVAKVAWLYHVSSSLTPSILKQPRAVYVVIIVCECWLVGYVFPSHDCVLTSFAPIVCSRVAVQVSI